MKKATQNNAQQEQETQVHPLHKSHMIISTKHVEYDNLTALEAVSMSLALVLAVTSGLLFTI